MAASLNPPSPQGDFGPLGDARPWITDRPGRIIAHRDDLYLVEFPLTPIVPGLAHAPALHLSMRDDQGCWTGEELDEYGAEQLALAMVVWLRSQHPCPECRGRGLLVDDIEPCTDCNCRGWKLP